MVCDDSVVVSADMARAPRRSFTASFVVTLAAAVPACIAPAPSPQQPVTSQPQPVTNPQPEPTPVTVENPPRPQPTETNPTKPTGPTPPMTPTDPGPTPTGATRDTVWTVMKSGTTCTAHARVDCPKGQPGQPMPTCNPPAPIPYACPAGWDGKTALAVTQYQGSTECVIEATVNCAPNEKCKRPAPTKVPCPKY